MASSLSISRASAVMGTILERSIDIPRDISFRGNLTLIDRSGSGEAVLKQENLLKLIDISDGSALSNKALIVDSNKDISGVNNQINTGQFIFDKSRDDEEGAIDLVFKRAKGTITNKIETFHGNHIGVLSFQPYVGSTYIDSAGIDVNTYKKSYSSQYSGSEIIFSNSGGSDINSGKHDSLKIDAMGNLNILKSKELRLNVFRDTNFSGIRPSLSTASPGYTIELPANKGSSLQTLQIDNIGTGGKLTVRSNNTGNLIVNNTYPLTITSPGSGYDPYYFPEVNTKVNMTGGTLKENGECSASNIYTITSTSVTVSDPVKLTINATPIEEGAKITVNTMDGTMGSELLTNNTYFVKITVGTPGISVTEIELYTDELLTNGVDTTGKTSTGVGTHTIIEQDRIYLSPTDGETYQTTGYYNGWTIETINPNSKRIIYEYVGTNGKAKLSSGISLETNTLTQYKLKQGHGSAELTRTEETLNESNVYSLSNYNPPPVPNDPDLSTVDNYYNGWTLIVDISGTFYQGNISSYDSTTKKITIIWTNEPTANISVNGAKCSLTNHTIIPASIKITSITPIETDGTTGEITGGEITSAILMDGGSGYIPNINIEMEIPSQTKLIWSSLAALSAAALQSPPSEGAFVDGDKTKLNSIVPGANVTNATTVAAAGALMVSELTDYPGIKDVTISDLQPKPFEGAFVDGDKTKLNSIDPGADVTDTANVTAAGALMVSELTDYPGIKGVTISDLQPKPFEGAFVDGDKTKLNGIDPGADVTDATTVAAAGALMVSELTDYPGIKGVTISDLQPKPFEGAFVDGDKTKLDGFIDWTASNAGTIDITNIPAIAITNTQTASDQTTHLALTAQQGDIVIRTDASETYVHNGGSAGTMSDYTLLATPTDAVASVSGKTGVVTLNSSDVGLGNVENTALSSWSGSSNITTLGTVTTGTWDANTLAVNRGGTGQITYSEDQILIGNSSGTLEKAILTAGSNISITKSFGALTIAGDYSNATTEADGLMSLGDKGILDGIEPGAQVNVKSDWSQTDPTKDDYIHYKPTIPDGNQVIDWTASNAGTIHATNNPTLQPKPIEGAFVDGDKTKLNGIDPGADVTDTANVTAAGALMVSELTDLAGVKGVTISDLQPKPSEGAFVDGDKTKLNGIDAGANVTDATTVAAAGALMVSDVTDAGGDLIQLKSFNPDLYITGHLSTGPGLTGGGDMSGNVDVKIDLSTHDSGGDTSGYVTLPDDKILLLSSIHNASRMPKISTFLTSIAGTGLTTDNGTGTLLINNSQSIITNISDYYKIYSSSNNQKTHYLNIGKGDNDHIKIKGEYKTSEELGIQPSTYIIGGKGTASITISKRTTAFIPSQTNITFTYPGQTIPITGIINDNTNAGSTTLILSGNSPNPQVTLGITGVSGIPSGTIVTNGWDTTEITISNPTTEIIPAQTNITFTYTGQDGDQTGVISSEVSLGSITIPLENIAPNPPIITVKITPDNYLHKTIIQTQSSKTSNDASIQFDIGNNTHVTEIDNDGLSVKRGFIESINVINGGSGYSSGDIVDITISPFGSTYTAEARIIVGNVGELVGVITNVEVIKSGIGYSSTTPPTIEIRNSSGTSAILSVQVNDSRHIIGQVNNYNARYDGYFKDLYISGDQNFQGTLTVTGKGAVELGKPSNLDFSEDDSNFLFGYEVGRGGNIRDDTGNDNTYIGYRTGFNSTISAEFNTFCGSNTGYDNTDGTKNTYIGYKAGLKGTTTTETVCVGHLAGAFLAGSYNTALGTGAGYSSSDGVSGHNGNNNVYLGYNTQSRDGSNNLFAGSNAGKDSTSSNGVFLGYNSGYSSTGDGNVFIGYESGYTTTTSLHNILIGYQSGYNISTNDTIISPDYTGNIMMGYKSGYNLAGDSSRNIIIGPNAGPPDDSGTNTHHNKLYISTRGESLTPLILGDQDTSNAQTLNFNADVTISKTNSTGKLTVEGGEIIVQAGDGQSTSFPNQYKINFPQGSTDTNENSCVVITNTGSGQSLTTTATGDGKTLNTMIGANMPTNPGWRNTIYGAKAGTAITGDNNTIVGSQASTLSSTGNYNTYMGARAGYNTGSGSYNVFLGFSSGYFMQSGVNNIILGYSQGPHSADAAGINSHGRLYIDTGGNGSSTLTSRLTYRNEDSLIYGDQGTSSTAHTLSFNADVTIKNTTTSDGNLEVQGGTINFWGGTKSAGGTGNIWNISVPSASGITSEYDRNIQITNSGRGLTNTTATDSRKKNVMVGAQMPTTPGSSNTLLGDNAGNLITGSNNTMIGSSSGSSLTSSNNNTCVGLDAGPHLTSDCDYNLCLGYKTGPTTDTSNSSRKLYIDAHGGINLEGTNFLYGFTTHTFTNCGSTGRDGPTLSECMSSYGDSGNWWNNTSYFNVIGAPGVNGIQVWTVPRTGTYKITAKGAREGWTGKGEGAIVEATFTLTKGDKYMILVGQMGSTGQGTGNWWASGGGGGTFMVKGDSYHPASGLGTGGTTITLSDALIIAGGGGGSSASSGSVSSSNVGGHGSNTSSNDTGGGQTSAGNLNGSGGGGGLITRGVTLNATYWGESFKNGGRGGGSSYTDPSGRGGFGGGGGAGGNPGGGGGGVYGGDHGWSGMQANSQSGGKGGGSHVNSSGSSITFSPTTNNSHGELIIEAEDYGVIAEADHEARGAGALIYGDQATAAHTLSFNAGVTIKKSSTSAGTLHVEDDLNVGGSLTTSALTTSLTATGLTIQDNNIDVEPTVGRTNFDYNLLFSNNSNTVNLTGIEKTTIFGTFSTHIDIANGSHTNTIFGYNCGGNITTGDENTLIGGLNGLNLTTGIKNTSLGIQNLYTTNTSNSCVGIGYRNLYSMDNARAYNIGIGFQNCFYVKGSYNIGIGKDSLQGTSGDGTLSYSIGIGAHTGTQSTGNYNHFIGSYSGYFTTGSYNVGIGDQSLRYQRSGSYNIAIGHEACRGDTAGNPLGSSNSFTYNIGLGTNALVSLSSGQQNIGIGYFAGMNIDTGHNNVCIGQVSGYDNRSGGNNTFLGRGSGRHNTTGDGNISIGYYAGRQTSGDKNISIGYEAGPTSSQVTWSDKLYIDKSRLGSGSLIYGDMSARTVVINGSLTISGSNTLTVSSFGSSTTNITGGLTIPSNKTLTIPSINQVTISGSDTNMYLGYQTGWGGVRQGNPSGNTYFGYNSGRQSNGSAVYNTYIGTQAGYSGTEAEKSTAVGRQALYSCIDGDRNTCIGYHCGYNVGGTYNTCIGYDAGPESFTDSAFNLYIDPVYRRGTESLIYGYGLGTTQRKIYLNAEVRVLYNLYTHNVLRFSDISLKRDIVCMEGNIIEKINLLRPVNYTLKSNNKKDIGFIAQDVKKIFPLLVKKDIKKNLLTIDYQKLTPYIVKGMQETNKEIKELRNELNEEKEKRENMEKFFKQEIEKLRKEIVRG